MMPHWLVLVCIATFTFTRADSIEKLSRKPILKRESVAFAEDTAWYRSEDDYIIDVHKNSDGVSIPTELAKHEIEILPTSNSRSIIFGVNGPNLPIYWTDGVKLMQAFNIASNGTIIQTVTISANYNDYILFYINEGATNVVVSLCLQTGISSKLPIYSQKILMVPDTESELFYLYYDTSEPHNSQLSVFDPVANTTSLITTVLFGSDFFLARPNVAIYSTRDYTHRTLLTENITDSVPSIGGLRGTIQTPYGYIVLTDVSMHFCTGNLSTCTVSYFETQASATAVYMSDTSVIYKPSLHNVLGRVFNNESTIIYPNLKIPLTDSSRTSNFYWFQYVDGFILFIGSEQATGTVYSDYLMAYDIGSQTMRNLQQLCDVHTCGKYQRAPYHIQKDGSLLLIKAENGVSHLFKYELKDTPVPTSSPQDDAGLIVIIIVGIIVSLFVLVFITFMTVNAVYRYKASLPLLPRSPFSSNYELL